MKETESEVDTEVKDQCEVYSIGVAYLQWKCSQIMVAEQYYVKK